MATITTGHNAPTGFSSGETVTATKLNNHVNSATIAFVTADDTDNSTLEASGGKLRAKDGGITAAKLASAAVTQAKLAANVAGNGPAFRAYASGTTSLPNNTATKVDLAAEDFDTNNNFASSRFTPTVEGYYQINASVYVTAAPQFLRADIYKNGSQVAGGVHTNQQTYLSNVSDLVYMNGTTDYVELYATQASGTTQAATAVSVGTFMSGFLARAA